MHSDNCVLTLGDKVIRQQEGIQIILLPSNIVSATLFTYSQVHKYLVTDKAFVSFAVYHSRLELKWNNEYEMK